MRKALGESGDASWSSPWPGDRPWRLRMRAEAMEVLADRSSRRDVLAAGAALLNLRLALEHAGLEPTVTLAPDDEHEVLARLRVGPQPPGASGDHHLFTELHRRRGGAPRFVAPSLPPELTAHLAAAVEAERARLLPFGDGWPTGQSYAVGLLVTDGDRVLDWCAGQATQRLRLTAGTAWLTVRCHAEPLDVPDFRERVRRDHCPDGVPQVMLELGRRTAPVA